jgi:hypothetical protein
MAITLYEISIPAFRRGLMNLGGLLDKAAAYAAAKNFDPTVLGQTRLFPDMFSLSRQIQVTCDNAKGASARLANIEIPKHEDTETTLPELKARIQKTLDFVQTVTPAQLEGAEARQIVLTFPSNSLKFTGLSYVTDFALPNFYFHLTVSYALLRASGVEIGKRDFLGAIQ